MPDPRYSHWNEEADIIREAENDWDSPMADMSDQEIKQQVYDRMKDDDYDDQGDWD